MSEPTHTARRPGQTFATLYTPATCNAVPAAEGYRVIPRAGPGADVSLLAQAERRSDSKPHAPEPH